MKRDLFVLGLLVIEPGDTHENDEQEAGRWGIKEGEDGSRGQDAQQRKGCDDGPELFVICVGREKCEVELHRWDDGELFANSF